MRLFLLLSLCGFSGALFAQQEQMYTQFMYNKLSYNPGSAGNFESPTLTIVDRHQWIGFEGAPNAQVLSYTQPILNRRVGLGGTLAHQGIGITRTITFEASYAYRIPFKRGYLGLGVQASLRQFAQNWADDRIVAAQEGDSYIPADGQYNKFFPNFGFGIFYTGYKWFAGAAALRLIPNDISFANVSGKKSPQVAHFNAMAGVTFDLGEDLDITPQILMRYVKGAPFDADINGTLRYKKKFYGGITYRTGGNTRSADGSKRGLGESADLLLGIQASKKLFVSASYDLSISRLRTQQSGSVELAVRWWFNPPEGVIGNTPKKAPKPLY